MARPLRTVVDLIELNIEQVYSGGSKHSLYDPKTIFMIVGIIVCFLSLVATILCCHWVRIQKLFRRFDKNNQIDNENPFSRTTSPPPPYDFNGEMPLERK